MKRKECAYVQAVIQLKLRLHFLSFCLEIFSLLYSLFIVIVGILQIPWKRRWVQQNRHANPTNSFFQLSFLSMLSFKAAFIKKFNHRPAMSDRFQSLKVLVPTVRRFSSIFIGTLKATFSIFYCHFPGLFIKFDVRCIFNSRTLGQQ